MSFNGMVQMNFLTENANKLTPYAIEEGIRAKAYEALPLSERASLKQAIARLYSFWGRHDYTEKRVREFASFSAHEQTAPCPYALVCCQVPFVRGVELIPALLPALLAGVKEVVPWFLGKGQMPHSDLQSGLQGDGQLDGQPEEQSDGQTQGQTDGETGAESGFLTHDILMTLELLGIEDAFYSTPQELAKLLQHDISLSQEGRFVHLGPMADNDSLLSLVVKQGVSMQYLAKGETVYPSLPPRWYCNHSVRFLP